MPSVVEVRGLAVAFPVASAGLRRVVDGVSLTVPERTTVAIVGESGCGKSLTALAILGLVPEPGRVVAGSVRLVGTDVLAADDATLSALRGAAAGLLSQEPSQALNPLRRVAFQVGEAARLRRKMGEAEAQGLVEGLLLEVGLAPAAAVARAYPHQLSGGQRQRVALASALSADPALLIADEPTSALDRASTAQLLDTLANLRERRGLAVLLISHDLGVVGRAADRVTVFHAGETVEDAPSTEIFTQPLHPYTRALLAARPVAAARRERFATIPGRVPGPGEWGRGCRFAPRCPAVFDRCRAARPALAEATPGRSVRCFLHRDAEDEDG
jgi:peptide/nickel transport system ATP-binding protein/oligopeptide transport system ATP-binding protein